MPITTYASVAQFFEWGLPPTALGARTVVDVQSALDAASSDMDDSFRGIAPLPFASVGLSVSRRCVHHARYLFMGGRGFSPVSGSDQDILRAEEDFQVWIDKVQRRALFPDIVVDVSAKMPVPISTGPLAQPFVVSSSAVSTGSGRRAPTRGW